MAWVDFWCFSRPNRRKINENILKVIKKSNSLTSSALTNVCKSLCVNRPLQMTSKTGVCSLTRVLAYIGKYNFRPNYTFHGEAKIFVFDAHKKICWDFIPNYLLFTKHISMPFHEKKKQKLKSVGSFKLFAKHWRILCFCSLQAFFQRKLIKKCTPKIRSPSN